MRRRCRKNFEVGHRQRTLADRGADAVGAGVAAADDDDVFAAGQDRFGPADRLAADAPVLLRQKLHRKMDAVEFAARNRQVARLLRAAGEHDGIVLVEQLSRRDIDADIGAVMKYHALGLHLHDAAVDVVFLHLEVGNAVAQQAASLRPALIDMHIVADAGELLRAGKARRPRSDDRDFLAGPHRWRLGP